MDLTTMVNAAREAGVEGLQTLSATLSKVGRRYHSSPQCKKADEGLLGGLLVLTPEQVEVNLAWAARKKKLCSCVNTSSLSWSAREALSGVRELVEVRRKTRELAAALTDGDPVQLVTKLQGAEGAVETLTRQGKNPPSETARAHALTGAAVEVTRARKALQGDRHRRALLLACTRGIRKESLPDAEAAGLVGEDEVLVHLRSHWAGSETNLLDAVVATYTVAGQPNTTLRCPRSVGNWAVWAARARESRAEVVTLEPGDTEEVLETMWGLFTPGEDGPLKTLQGALEAARRV